MKKTPPCQGDGYPNLCSQKFAYLPRCGPASLAKIRPKNPAILKDRLSLGELPEISDLLLGSGKIKLKASSWSMYPTIKSGDFIKAEPVGPGEVKKDDLVLYSNNGNIILHRVVKKCYQGDKAFFLTKGDNQASAEALPIAPESILGRLVAIERSRRMFFSLRNKDLALLKAAARVALTGFQHLRIYRWFARLVLARKIFYRVGVACSKKMPPRFYNYLQINELNNSTVSFNYHLIAKSKDKVIGNLNLIMRPEGCLYPGFWIYNLFVRLPYRGAHIGSGLVRLSLQLAAMIGAPSIFISVPRKNRIAVNMFKELAFRPTEWQMRDLLVMYKPIKPKVSEMDQGHKQRRKLKKKVKLRWQSRG